MSYLIKKQLLYEKAVSLQVLEALQRTRPYAVCISAYPPDTHEAFAVQALTAGCHVFLQKPLATTLAGAERVVAAARQAGKQVLVGYILRVHPSWARFVEEAP